MYRESHSGKNLEKTFTVCLYRAAVYLRAVGYSNENVVSKENKSGN
jgi:hypothetical protein